MSIERFDTLVAMLRPKLKKTAANRLSVGHQLAIALRFLATGDSYKSLAFGFRVGVTTVHKVVTKTCFALWTVLQPTYLPAKTWAAAAEQYKDQWNFPLCCSAVDGKHVTIQQPANSGSLFFNYKGSNSIVLMAIADASCKFLAVDIGAYPSNQ